ncbi:unnamed protein product, partial [Rotaria sp. Silwood1]
LFDFINRDSRKEHTKCVGILEKTCGANYTVPTKSTV